MKSIRWKIIILCTAVMLAPVLLLNRYSVSLFDTFNRTALEDQMITSAFIVGELYKTLADENGILDVEQRVEYDHIIKAYAHELQAHIQLLSTHGCVLIDSSSNAVIGVDLSALPEVAAALGGAYKARCALTPDRKFMYYYIALPVMSDERVHAVSYLSQHTGAIITTLNEMVLFQRVTTAAAMLAGILLATVLAYTLTGRLRRLTTATTAYAHGHAPLEVQVSGRDEIAELARSINIMAAEIQKTNTYNREFISTVMHELKMPITAIKGAAELLVNGAVNKPEARDKFLSNIRFEADRLARLVWELNELTKLDISIPHSPRTPVDYGRCVQEIVDRCVPMLDTGHAPITVTVPATPIHTQVVPDRIEQVIGNLIDNAVRYTPSSGEIEIKVEPGPDRTVITSIRDTGCGILPSNIPRIFNRFFTTEPKDKPKDFGSGLGLAIAKSIVENHQGKIWVESMPGQGSTFFFSLPVAEG